MFPGVYGFIATQQDVAPATVRKLLTMLDTQQLRALIQIEMAAFIDTGEVVVKATYNLEGDGPLALVAYGIIRSVHASLQSAHFPSLSALRARLHPNDVNNQLQLKALGMQCVQPGIDHFMKKFVGTAQVRAQFSAAGRFLQDGQVPQPRLHDRLTAIPGYLCGCGSRVSIARAVC